MIRSYLFSNVIALAMEHISDYKWKLHELRITWCFVISLQFPLYRFVVIIKGIYLNSIICMVTKQISDAEQAADLKMHMFGYLKILHIWLLYIFAPTLPVYGSIICSLSLRSYAFMGMGFIPRDLSRFG